MRRESKCATEIHGSGIFGEKRMLLFTFHQFQCEIYLKEILFTVLKDKVSKWAESGHENGTQF